MSGTEAPESRLAIFRADFAASCVVFLVALPLSLGIAGACNIPAESAVAVGILSSVVGGVVVGAVAGCPLQVTGPAAGLIAIVLQIVLDPKVGYERLGSVILLSGVLQLVAAFLKTGQWFRSVVPSVIEGMLAGIGLLILVGQVHVLLDYNPPGQANPHTNQVAKESNSDHDNGSNHFVGLRNLLAIPTNIGKAWSDSTHRTAGLLGGATLLLIFLWEQFAPSRLRVLPAPLVGIVAATLVAYFFHLEIKYLSAPKSIYQAARSLPQVDWQCFTDSSIWLYSLTVAVVASAESLITAAAVDRMKTQGPRTNYNREMAAQGIGNIICGFGGLLPLTGVIVRSSANVRFGGRTRLSTIMHGIWMFMIVAFFPAILGYIPSSALAAILVFTGLKLAHPEPFIKLKRFSLVELGIGLVTLIIVFSVDLLWGIGVGMGLALTSLLYSLSHLTIQHVDHPEMNRTDLSLTGAATFLSLSQFENALHKIPQKRAVHIEIDDLTHLDHACLEMLIHWEEQHTKTGGTLFIDWQGLTALQPVPVKLKS